MNLATGFAVAATKKAEGDSRRWPALGILLVGAFLPPLDFFIVNVALPSIRSDLKASGSILQLVISGYATAYAVMLITGGRLGDLYGRRLAFIVGMLGFAASSALSGLAWSPVVLVVGRVCQGLTAAIMAPQPLASIEALFSDDEKPRALGFYAMAFGLASAAGLLLGGGLILASPLGLGWRSIFLINLPIVAVTIPLALVLLKETRANEPEQLDSGGALLLAAALFALVLPLVEGREYGWPFWSWLLMATSLPLLIGFWIYELRLDARGGDPLVVPKVIAAPGMKQGLTAALFFYALAAFWLFFSVYDQSGRGKTPFQTGIDILPAAVGFIFGPLISSRLERRVGRWTAPTGMVLLAIGLIGTALCVLYDTAHVLSLPLFAIGLGQGVALPAMTHTITGRVHRKWSGLAAGLVTSMFQIGGALSVAVIGGLFYSLLGNSPTNHSLAQAYAVAVSCIALSLLLAAGLTAGVRRTGSENQRHAT